MGETLWINGNFVDRASAQVSAFDSGLQHGVGLFETMLASNGRVFRLAEHMGRMDRSARALGLSESLRTGPLGEAVERVVERSGLASGGEKARVRLTVTGGDLNMLSAARGSAGAGDAHPTVMIHAQPAMRYPAEMFERGVTLVIPDAKANPLNPQEGHKTLNYWWRLRALQEAAAKGAGECLVLQVTNHIAGGAVSNLFAVREGTLVTPIARGEEERGSVGSPVLPGITRGAVIDLAQAMGVGCAKRMVTMEDVLDADEVFLTNTGWGMLPVTRIEGREIADGAVGSMTRELRSRWDRAVEVEV